MNLRNVSVGKFRHKILFQVPSTQIIGGGGNETIYTDELRDWCHAFPIDSSMVQSGHGTTIKTAYRFIVRYRENFTPAIEMRIVYKGRSFSLVSVKDIQEKMRFWEIDAVEHS